MATGSPAGEPFAKDEDEGFGMTERKLVSSRARVDTFGVPLADDLRTMVIVGPVQP